MLRASTFPVTRFLHELRQEASKPVKYWSPLLTDEKCTNKPAAVEDLNGGGISDIGPVSLKRTVPVALSETTILFVSGLMASMDAKVSSTAHSGWFDTAMCQ